MTISINTKDYIKTYAAEIDGVSFKVRALTTAENISLQNLSRDAAEAEKAKNSVGTARCLEEISDLIFNLFDDVAKAKEILSNLPMDALAKIYQDIIAGGKDGGEA